MRSSLHEPRVLSQALLYDRETGIIYWKIDRKCGNGRLIVKAGDKAGCEVRKGRSVYVRIRVFGVSYYGHQVAWALENGEWADTDIDHMDGNGLNNRISNLRLATRSQNSCNSRVRVDNKSGFKGVCWDKSQGRWRAVIRHQGILINLGAFVMKDDAVKSYAEAAKKFQGEFRRQ